MNLRGVKTYFGSGMARPTMVLRPAALLPRRPWLPRRPLPPSRRGFFWGSWGGAGERDQADRRPLAPTDLVLTWLNDPTLVRSAVL
jgi:hypothetical protein